MTSHEIVLEVRQVYPKFSKAALSLGRRPLETGVCFTTRAAEIIDHAEGRTTPCETLRENRRKSVKFMCRLSPTDAWRVKHAIKAHGFESVQEWLENLVLTWEKENRSALPTQNGPKEMEKIRASSTSEIITKV